MACSVSEDGEDERTIPTNVTLGLVENPGASSLSFMQLDRIKIDPAVCEGRPTVRGLRFTVDFILKLIGSGYTADDIVREYPLLEKEDVYQAARYGAWLANERNTTRA